MLILAQSACGSDDWRRCSVTATNQDVGYKAWFGAEEFLVAHNRFEELQLHGRVVAPTDLARHHLKTQKNSQSDKKPNRCTP